MVAHTRRGRQIVVVVALVLLSGLWATPGRADFTLTGTDYLLVNSQHDQGALYNQSQADIVSGGDVGYLSAYDESTVNVYDGGRVGELSAYGGSTVTARMEDEWSAIAAYDTSTVAVEGEVSWLSANDASTVYAGVRAFGVSVSGASTLTGGVDTEVLIASGTSTVHIGGTIGTGLSSYNESKVTASGVNMEYGGLSAYDTSTVDFSGGSGPHGIGSYDSSIVTISDIPDGWKARAYGDSTLNLFDAYIEYDIQAWDNSTVNFSGRLPGAEAFEAHETSTANLLGGPLDGPLYVYAGSTVNFLGVDLSSLVLDSTLSLDGNRLLGTGLVSGLWLDGTAWETYVGINDGVIRIVPAPGAVLLGILGLGYSGWRLRRRSRCETGASVPA